MQFRELSLDELAESRKLRVHADSVFTALDAIIENLGDLETVTEMLNSSARRHYTVHGIEYHHYEVITLNY